MTHRKFENGELLREALGDGSLKPRQKIVYFGCLHEVIETLDQGLRVAACRVLERGKE